MLKRYETTVCGNTRSSMMVSRYKNRRGCVKIDTSSLPVTLIWVLKHTLVWVSVNYIYSYSLAVLMLYILFSIAIVVCVFVPRLLFLSIVLYCFIYTYNETDNIHCDSYVNNNVLFF